MDDKWKIIKHLDFPEVPTHQTYQNKLSLNNRSNGLPNEIQL